MVQVGKRKVELSNLDKVLFPRDHIVKAEIIEYYLKIAPTILSHIKGRLLTLVRFPDGVDGEKFYQKNRPQWAPDWIEYTSYGGEKKDYMIATEEASLVWLANLACLEMHQMHARKPHFDQPDYMVFDLDPPEGYNFPKLIKIAEGLRDHIESYGYHTFVKTTGGKGLHIVAPLEPKWDFHTVFEAAQSIAKPFVEVNGKETTLHIRKESRKGRVLIDIYRIRNSQSIISPYSLRGVDGAPVSMPLHWEQLKGVKDPKQFNIKVALDQILSEGDAWEGIGAYSVALHTKRKSGKNIKDLGPNPHYKTPETLESYQKKRDFKKTAEPSGKGIGGNGDGFVVHRHHASRLHYDLRLEEEGTLKSWAVPRGLPPRPGIKRLAVATEDHPLKYLDFEGTIPKGQYGGGDMWIYALGKYEKIKEKKKGFYFNLYSKELNGEYRIHLMKEKEWLLERVDNPQVNWVQDPIEPMLAQSLKEPPQSGDYIFEVKWDGIRALISLDEGKLVIRSRSQRDITHKFPELVVPEQAFRATSALFDGEIVCLDAEGKPDFKKVIKRLMQSSKGGIERGSVKNPAYCYLFDCLYLDGRAIVNEPLLRRREWLNDSVKRDTPYRVSEVVTEGLELFEAAKQLGVEGIMAKDPNSRYLPGKRTSNWIKIKVRQTTECLIIGFTEGKGDRLPYFGALQIAELIDNDLKYRGKVGTGFDQKLIKQVFEQLKKGSTTTRQIKEKPLDEAQTTWLIPQLYCEIQYASLTKNGTYREPVFLRMRPDLEAK